MSTTFNAFTVGMSVRIISGIYAGKCGFIRTVHNYGPSMLPENLTVVVGTGTREKEILTHANNVTPVNLTPGDHYSEKDALGWNGVWNTSCEESGLFPEDVARECFVLSVCLGCASVMVAGDALTAIALRSAIDWDACECCPDATRIVY